MSSPGGVGFFGKLPGMGDFVQRRLPPDFVAAWDACFEAGVDAARNATGDAWRSEWPQTPLWRFALAPGVCGRTAWVGAMGPSIDRVGRTFPLVLASAVADVADLVAVVRAGNGWFVELERACRGACGPLPLSVDEFDAFVTRIGDPRDWLNVQRGAAAEGAGWPARDSDPAAWLAADDDRALADLATACFGERDGCLWWTLGGWRVAAGARLTHGLPRADAYPAFIGAAAPATPPAGGSAAIVAASVPVDLLADLLPETPADTAVAGDATIPFARRSPAAPAPAPLPATADAGAVVKQVGAATLIAANNGVPDTRRRAVAEVLSALAGAQWWEAEPAAVCARLLELHPVLKERRDDLLDPVPEDGVVIAANVRGGQAGVWWIGSAAAWHWQRGQLRLLQPSAAAAGGCDDVTRPATPGAVAPRPVRGLPGLGAAGEPRCGLVACPLLPGERLLLLATDTLVALPEGVLAAALAAATGAEACARIAAAAGLGGERARWPLAVIEVGT